MILASQSSEKEWKTFEISKKSEIEKAKNDIKKFIPNIDHLKLI